MKNLTQTQRADRLARRVSAVLFLAALTGGGCAHLQKARTDFTTRYVDRAQSVLECWREIAVNLPAEVELSQLDYRGTVTGVVKITGQAARADQVCAFRDRLNACPLFTNVTIASVRVDANTQRQIFDVSLALRGVRPGVKVPTEMVPIFHADKNMDVHWLTVIEEVALKHGIVFLKRQIGQELAVGDAFELPVEIRVWQGSEEAMVHFLYDLDSLGVGMLDVCDLAMQVTDKGILTGRLVLHCLYTKIVPGRTPRPASATALTSAKTVRPPAVTDFARYQVILDRKTFRLPVATAPPPPEPFVKNLRLTMLIADGKSIHVGIVDFIQKQNYFLAVGETKNGITVVEVNVEGERVLLRKGNEEYWLAMSKG